MSTVVAFRGRKSAQERVSEVFAVYRRAKPSLLTVRIEEADARISSASGRVLTLRAGSEPFSVFKELRRVYANEIGLAKIEVMLADIRANCNFSNHICDKVVDFIRSGRPYFKREAQFPPEIIRRPEKNLYFATTFNMIVTQLFTACHKVAFTDRNEDVVYVVPNAEMVDRCSLRLIQNMLLAIKPFGIHFELTFTPARGPTDEAGDAFQRRFIAARRRCFRKLMHVALASGNADAALDVDAFLTDVGFASAFERMLTQADGVSRPDLDELRDMIYRNNYENFYIALKLHDQSPWLSAEDLMRVRKLEVLCDSFNYSFDDALTTTSSELKRNLPAKNQCYHYLMRGLIFLKKQNDAPSAVSIMQEGLLVAARIESPLERTVETAFLKNALNFVRVVEVMTTLPVDARHDALTAILDDEHAILQTVCEAFISVPASQLEDRNRLLDTLFILTTLVENIGKLNALCGRRDETIELYTTYQDIFDTVGQRMKEDTYKRSFTISFSHALVHTRVAVAAGHAAAKRYQVAYDMTKTLLNEAEQYDITGDYQGFILNAHALNAARIGNTNESVECLSRMAALYLEYNEPYMIKVAFNRLAPHLKANDPGTYSFLSEVGVIDQGFQSHDEATFLVSSAVDLENPLLGGLEQMVFGKRSFNEMRRYQDEDRSLKAAFRSYGHWRQITQLGA